MPKPFQRDTAKKLEHQQVRAALASQPSLKELLASGDYSPPIPQHDYLQLHQLAGRLKQAREAANISLNDLAEKSGVDRGAIWKLESGRHENPTVETLSKLARALGYELGFQLTAV